MIVDEYLDHVELHFKYRKLILEAIKDKRAELLSKKITAGRNKKSKTDPTCNQAIKKVMPIDKVTIYPNGHSIAITIKNPEKWMQVVSETYKAYKNKPIGVAVLEHYEKGLRHEVISGLMGISRQSYWRNRKAFFTDAAFLAEREKLL